MALEPITRQEQIIAGKDLEPITRMEKFLKKYGGSGGSGGVSPEEVTTIVKEQFPGGVGYADKAFEPVVVENTTEKSVELEKYSLGEYGYIVKISDEYTPIASQEQVGNIYLKTVMGGQENEMTAGGEALVIGEHGYNVDANLVGSDGQYAFGDGTIPKGLWSMDLSEVEGVSLTVIINPSAIIKPISAEYLPNVADIPETWIAELKAALGI